MKKLLLILLLSVAFTACKSARPRVDTVKAITTDTQTTIRYIKKTDTVPIAGALVKIKVPLKDLSETPTTKTSGRATATITKIDDNIEVECECAAEKVLIKSQNEIIETLTNRLETNDTTVTKIEYRTPWWAKILSGIGAIALVLLALRFLRPF